jgi:hypothetical protein
MTLITRDDSEYTKLFEKCEIWKNIVNILNNSKIMIIDFEAEAKITSILIKKYNRIPTKKETDNYKQFQKTDPEIKAFNKEKEKQKKILKLEEDNRKQLLTIEEIQELKNKDNEKIVLNPTVVSISTIYGDTIIFAINEKYNTMGAFRSYIRNLDSDFIIFGWGIGGLEKPVINALNSKINIIDVANSFAYKYLTNPVNLNTATASFFKLNNNHNFISELPALKRCSIKISDVKLNKIHNETRNLSKYNWIYSETNVTIFEDIQLLYNENQIIDSPLIIDWRYGIKPEYKQYSLGDVIGPCSIILALGGPEKIIEYDNKFKIFLNERIKLIKSNPYSKNDQTGRINMINNLTSIHFKIN